MPGLYLEEFTAGRHFRHELSRTVTDTDDIWFSLSTMNPQPLHVEFGHRCYNRHDELVAVCRRAAMMRKKEVS